MAIAFGTPVTTGGTFAPGTSTLTASLTVGAGSTILAAILSAGTTSVLSCSDNVNGAYTQVDALNDATFTSSGALFRFTNSASGSLTITASFATATSFPVLSVVEIIGAVTTGIDGHNAAQQSAGAGSTLSPGAFSTAAQPALVVGWNVNDTGNCATSGAAGYTVVTTGAATGSWEWNRVTATGAQTPTWTSSDFGGHMTFGVAIDEASGAAAQVPFRRQQLLVPPDEEYIQVRRARVTASGPNPSARVPYRRPTLPQEPDQQFLFMGLRSATIQSGVTTPDSPPLGWPQRVISLFRTYEEDPGRFRRPVVTPSAPSDNPPWGFPRRVQGMYALQYVDPQDPTPRFPRVTASGAVNPPAPAPTPTQPTNTGPFDWRADYAAIIGQMFRGGKFPHQI